jgi:hypothetical protein
MLKNSHCYIQVYRAILPYQNISRKSFVKRKKCIILKQLKMKKLVFGIVATVTFTLITNAQEFEKPQSEILHDTKVSGRVSEKLTGLDASLLEQVKKYLEVERISAADFNTEDVYQEDLKEYGGTVYTVNFKDENIKLGFCVLVDSKSGAIKSSSFVKTTKYTFEHFFVEDASGFKLTKTDKGGVTLTSTYGKKGKGLGQQLIDCINDCYSGHGWISTGLFVATLFEPWVGGGVAYHCYCQVFGM